jgi:pyruvate dehydrogenase phosphatase
MVVKRGNRLTVANAGDCRTVMGSQINNTYYATRLSRDHNARVALEVAHLERQHPGEDDVVRCHKNNPSACYVKGRLQLTRSLGDLYLKNTRFNAKEGQPRAMGRHIPDPYTPPYVSHLPDMTHVRLDPQDKFAIVASDGVWDFLSDEEAVRIVGDCLSSGGAQGKSVPEKQLPGSGAGSGTGSGIGSGSTGSTGGGVSVSDLAASILVEATLRRAADECGMTYEQLLALPPGKHRRSRHDDTTVVVLLF